MTVPSLTPQEVVRRYRIARDRRAMWEAHWQECYEFALPMRSSAVAPSHAGRKRMDRVFDGTALDAVDQLAAGLMAHLTPPNGRWFQLVPGPAAPAQDKTYLAEELERSTSILLSHFDRSNFAVEIHQCYLDLVTAGTASLLMEEAPAGDPAAFRFTAVPLSQLALEEGASGRLDTSFRKSQLPVNHFVERYPEMRGTDLITRKLRQKPTAEVGLLEAVIPETGGYRFLALVDDAETSAEADVVAQGYFTSSPFINFRWLKAPGEIYGRSPVMKALPDIKTANKVVELVLKNASIAVTGIWQADDDGILNPATIKLTPGTIIPKAMGSAGLTPLAAPGRFDVSELVLDQLRERIRKALFVDKLGQVNGPRMTATEVLERAAEMARVLGATVGRLQTEFIGPLVTRASRILTRRGEIANLPIDGHLVALDYRSPLGRYQAQQDAQNTMLWLSAVREMGPQAQAVLDPAATARWLAGAMGVPAELLVPEPPPAATSIMEALASLSGADAGPLAQTSDAAVADAGPIGDE